MFSMKRRVLIVLVAVSMVLVETLAFTGTAYADVGSIAEGEDITYDKNGGVLQSLGFDTSKIPSTYNADATTNPYGSDVSTLNEVEEIIKFSTPSAGGDSHSSLLGHNKKLNGEYDSFSEDPLDFDTDFLDGQAFFSTAKCDINGDGRDSALAVVYTNYDYNVCRTDDLNNMTEEQWKKRTIFMRLYDPKTGTVSDPVEIARFRDNSMTFNYMVQSQMQIAAGDFDKDSIDEIAVYAPAGSATGRNKIVIFDLTEGRACENPYSIHSWRQSWNYVLPISSEEVIDCNPEPGQSTFVKNIYNNIDLTSGDADNDGICDLIISYGASDTSYSKGIAAGYASQILRYLPSKSVLLYGSDAGQMLKDSQDISYAGNELIRVSFAFGDIDGDGNEDMFIGGQMQDNEKQNQTRVIGRYIYDQNAKEMVVESMQNMAVIDGQWNDDNTKFTSANGWDGYYYSVPLMKANLAIGKVMGPQSDTGIYLDSVLYSYNDGTYDITDELEDTSTYEDDKQTKPKGSQVFTDMTSPGNPGSQAEYFEFGADAGNFAGALNDYILVSRISVWEKDSRSTSSASAILLIDKDRNLTKKQDILTHENQFVGASYYMATGDTDKDSMVARYTGIHDITYSKPKVLCVLASAPYFKDVADYDGGDMLNWCGTSYGTKDGTTNGYKYEYSHEIGVFVNGELGNKYVHAVTGWSNGQARSDSWGHDDTNEFEVSYDTAGGEDAVIMYSTPQENYVYDTEFVTLDDDGNYTLCKQSLVLSDNHKPVTQVLTLEDYMEIQKKNTDELPDITDYLKSTPGDPSTYPKSENDIPQAAKDKLINSRTAQEYEGIAYGSGTITQTLSHEHVDEKEGDSVMTGVYADIDIGLHGMLGDEDVFYVAAEIGVHQHYAQMEGPTKQTVTGEECSGTVVNMPRAAKGYGYDFSWKLFEYDVMESFKNGVKYTIPIVSYVVTDVTAPPRLPDSIDQDFDDTTDSQIALTWTYNYGDPQQFEIYRYEDFPQGGGDKLVGTVSGSDFQIMKDEDGNTLKDKNGHVIRQYSFIDTDLTADTKYNYRMKVKSTHLPPESIFSPIIEARTKVSEMPNISLSTDTLAIHKDGTYEVKVNLADPEHYQKDINYQWQKYDEKKRKWEDYAGRDKVRLEFYNCKPEDAGKYRCRVNLIRKVESNPQYISAYTETCTVTFSLRDVVFGDISVFEGEGKADVNTGVSVSVYNSSTTSTEKPVGEVWFYLKGPNGTIPVGCSIDETTGAAKVNSIEDMIGTTGQMDFVDGGYVVTARYKGSKVFYPADCPEEYHYLRNIDECIFLSTKSSYYFGDDVAKDAELFDYKKDSRGKVTRTDLTDKLTTLKFYKVGENDQKTGDAVATYDLSETGGKALVPLNKDLVKKAYVEAYMEGEDDPVASNVISTLKIQVQLSMKEKMTGTGDLLEFVDADDVELSNGVDAKEKNIETSSGKKSLSDYMLFKYYEQNGDYMYDSSEVSEHSDEFIPASYTVEVSLKGEDEEPFYTASYQGAKFMVVGNYYLVTAEPKESSSGRVQMISPDNYIDFEKKGYAGGTKIMLKALPNKGYEIRHWIVNECGDKEYTLPGDEKITYSVKSQNTTGTGEIKIQAVMKPKNNTIAYSAVGQGDVTVTPSVDNGSTVLADTKLTFTAKPKEGWRFEEWRFVNTGGNNIVSGGVQADDGTNTKVFTMPDNSVEAYGVFARDTIDILTSNDIEISYINDGSNPDYEVGAEVVTQRGKAVPRGAVVTARTKPGVILAPGANWDVSVTTDEGIVPVDVEEIMSQGRQGCRFTLPPEVVSCAVSVDTIKGQFSVSASADDVDFTILVDGAEMSESTVNGIMSGSQVDIKAKPARGKVLSSWIINGEEVSSSETTYSVTITKNLNVSATTASDEELKLTLSTEGGGEGKCIITDKNGEEHEETFTDTQKEVIAYKGESAFFEISDEDTEHTLTSLYMDGEYQELVDGTFTLSEIEKDTTILCRFGQNTFYEASFIKDVKTDKLTILDEDGAEISDGDAIEVPKGGTLEFSVVLPDDMKFQVTKDVDKLTPYDSEDYDAKKRYYFKVEQIGKPVSITVMDRLVEYIYTGQDLSAYFATISEAESPSDQPDGILMKTIDMSNINEITLPQNYYAEFNGNGYAIQNLSIGTGQSAADNFYGIFGNLQEGSCVRDVTILNAEVHAKTLANASTDGYSGLLTYTNRGVISRVTIEKSKYTVVLRQGSSSSFAGGIAYDNHGMIEYCKISDLTINTGRYTLGTGCGCVVFNQQDLVDGEGTMIGNYVEKLYIQDMIFEQPTLSKTDLIAVNGSDDKSIGEFKDNYFDAGYEGHDDHGINVYSITDSPDDRDKAEAEVAQASFSRKLAYTMNKKLKDDIWGVAPDDSTKGIYQIIPGAKNLYEAPIKITYSTPNKTIQQYVVPGSRALPGEELFGDDTPDAWEIGNKAYAPGTVYSFGDDMTVTGVLDLTDYVAVLSDIPYQGEVENVRYYKDVNDAIKDAMSHNEYMEQELQIVGEGQLSETTVELDEKTTVVVKNGAALTIKENVQINNRGMLTVEQGATVHKYGSLFNLGQIAIINGSSFYNYGSAFDDKGLSTGKGFIICEPHICVEWRYSSEPDDNGKMVKWSVCTVCGEEVSDEIDPNPPATQIKSIGVLREPDKTIYELGDKFTDEGLVVFAELTDGTRALIDKYTMTLIQGDDEEDLKNGDAMNNEGDGKVTVKYNRFKCDFDILVINTAELLTLTDADGEEITEAELEPGKELQIKASLKSKLPYETQFLWETSDENVAALDGSTGSDRTVTARAPGDAVITVTVLDEKGSVIQSIKPKTVAISNVSHITDLKILGGDVSIDKDAVHEFILDIDPPDTTDIVEWSSSDESVAVVDQNGVATATGGGEATITVSAPSGLSDSRKIFVHEKAKDLTLEPDTMNINAGGFDGITAMVENGCANGEVTWTTSDASILAFFVRNDETGEMEAVDKITTKLSADGNGTSDTYAIVTGIAEGNAVVTAETESETGGMLTKECQVTVGASDKYVYITHNGARASGESFKLSLDGRFLQLGVVSSEENDTFTWTRLDDDKDPVIKVDSNGGVTLKRKGTAAVKVTSDITGETDVCLINVFIRPSGVRLSDTELSIEEGGKRTLTATLLPDGAEGKVLWSTSDADVAKVSDDGVVTAVKEGEATIKAVPDNLDAEPAFCTVTVHSNKLTVELSKTSYIFDGKKKKPSVTVKCGSTVLASGITKSDSNVMLMYDENSWLPGTYKVTAIARDTKYGSGVAKYKIKVKPTAIKSIKKGRRKFTVRWKKVAKKNVKGYLVRYSTKKSMKKAKYKTIKGYDKTKLTVKNLKGGKKYYVQVRSIFYRHGVKYCSTWSKKKVVRPKK